MEIRRCASRRPGAETRTVVRESEPHLAWDSAGVRLLLRTEDNPSWRDDNTYYDYEVSLSPGDIERIRLMLSGCEQQTEEKRG